MTVADRIKRRREELKLTQDELASKMGYASKSAVSRTENSGDNIGQKRIVAFAKALDTTPAYLMGWTDVTISTEPMFEGLFDELEAALPSDAAMEVARAYDEAPAAIQKAVKKLLDIPEE